MRSALTLLILSFIPLVHAENIFPPPVRSIEDRLVERQKIPMSWKLSLAPVIATQVLDVTSSYGKRELNPMLAGPDGRFGARAAAVKLGAGGALLGVEYLIVRAHPGSARFFTKINWAGAALTGGFAIHNFSVH